ncbi:MAG: hypothetical protein IKW95_04610 [Lachnospiraceae bacterium]|nr:hypothetical protein [Lachnospiraceae bacterium]
MRRVKGLLSLIVAVAIVLCSCGKSIDVRKIIGTDQMKVEPYHASFVVDENDIIQVTTYASYVFVAEVIDYDKTEYINGDANLPLTYYHVRVKENIKGSLRTDEDIVVKKAGGVRKGTDTFLICEGDVLPKPGNTYLFSAVIFEDDLYCPMPNMVIGVENSEDVSNNPFVLQFKEACNNPTEEVPNGNQYKSKYDSGEE